MKEKQRIAKKIVELRDSEILVVNEKITYREILRFSYETRLIEFPSKNVALLFFVILAQ